MPLPVLNDVMTNPNPNALPLEGAVAHPPATGGTVVHQAKTGHAAWAVHTLNVGAVGADNYRFIPASQNHVSYCVCPSNAGDYYIISDQYGGCEYHVLYSAAQHLFGFLHVYRGGGHVTAYTVGGGWVVLEQRRSAVIAQTYGMAGSNWSVSHVHGPAAHGRNQVDTTFVHINGTLHVTGVENGTTPYPGGGCTIL